jgi:hypothetical protein
MKQNKPIIYLGSGIIGAVIFAVMTFLGFTPDSTNVVQAGSFEFEPEMVRNVLAVLVPILIPLINKKWPGVGDIIQKLLGFLLPKEGETVEADTPDAVAHASLCNLCKLIEDDARRGKLEQAEIGLKWYILKVRELAPENQPVPDEVAK